MRFKSKSRDAYAAAGVSIDAGNEAVRRMRKHVRLARTPGMLTDIGLFGGLFQLPAGYQQPILVGSTDGIGTKLKVAVAMGKYDSVGQDLVNHCVNDILVQGASPLFFMDYFATGKLHPGVAEQIVKGLAKACRENECALLGGETAEMPGLYRGRDFDLAGTIIGLVEKKNIIAGRDVCPGDLLIGLPSTGLHTNGYSLARKIFFEKMKINPKKYIAELGTSLGEALLAVHRSYWPVVKPLLRKFKIKGMAHITGGGLNENLPRVLPEGCRAAIRPGTWPIPPIFRLLVLGSKLDEKNMYRTLNMGIGLVIIAAPGQAKKIIAFLRQQKELVYVIGEIEQGKKSVCFK
ncbi:phosphoribosylformylglycinamidine cyclo-ligase [candidate division FCPU426 bacterium]|nr:phosphoribosylformylglycinamidine cyclo-ligase [candidate division FCPU426 bacterium]